MARYFFHLTNGCVQHDEDGIDLDSLAEAKCQAVRFAGQMICDSASEFWNAAEWGMTVANEGGLTLFTLEMVGTESPAVDASRSGLASRLAAEAQGAP